MSCLRHCKDTKIKANHNRLVSCLPCRKLSKTLQRYENKSKSQPLVVWVSTNFSCLRHCKDTKIKANHNHFFLYLLYYMLSKTLQRYENKSKSQLLSRSYAEAGRCLRHCKDTKIKANHNYIRIVMVMIQVV